MPCSAEKERALLSQGWVKRFMADEPRLSQAVGEYHGLGFEVHLEPVDPKACAASRDCTACFETPAAAGRFKIIFTRSATAGRSTPPS